MAIDAVISTLLRSACGLVFLFAGVWVAYLVVCRWLGEARASARWMAALSLTLLLHHALLGVLDAFTLLRLHLFRPWVALPAVLLLAMLAHRRFDGDRAREAFRQDVLQAVAAIKEVSGSWVHRGLILWAAVAAGARALAGMVSPPLTWDTLTYHALKSAEWVQYGHKARTLAPDQWGYYTFYPDAAEVPGAWSMLFLRSDLGLPLVGIGLWLACGFAVYALARALQATRKQAFRAGLLVAFLPALLGEMVSGYSDMFVLLAFLALGFALVLLLRRRGLAQALFVGAVAGLLASAKFSGLPAACLALAFLLFVPAPVQPSISRLRAFLVAGAAALLMAGPHYLGVWIECGSPLYPLTVKIGGLLLSSGNPQLRALFAGELGVTDPRWASGIVLLQSLVLPYSLPKVEFAGFGPALFLLAPLGCISLLAGLVQGKDRRERFAPMLAPMILALLPVVGIMSKDLAGQRAMWLPNLGRLLLPLPAVLAVLGAGLRSRAASICMIAALVITMTLAWPAGVANAMLDAIARLAPWLALALTLAAFAALGCSRHPFLQNKSEWLIPSTIGLAGLLLIVPLAKVRNQSRYAIYEAACAPVPAFIMQFTWPQHAAAWPLWQALDDGIPHRIHASYGWDGLGHNGLRYPLLGSHLQNRVFYLPITRDPGPIIDYQQEDRVRQEADEVAWLDRLRGAGIDRVFLGEPAPPEKEFVLRHPERFQLIGRGQGNLHALYRFVP